MTISYFSMVEHNITRLHTKFHIFMMHQYLVMDFTRNYTFFYFLKKDKSAQTFLTHAQLAIEADTRG